MDRKLFKSRVARRMFFLFILCSLLPISILSFITYSQVTQHLKKESQNRLDQASRAIGRSLLERLSFLENDLTMVLTNLSRQGFSVSPSSQLNEHLMVRFRSLGLIKGPSGFVPILGKVSKGLPSNLIKYLRSGKKKVLLFSHPQKEGLPRLFIGKVFDSKRVNSEFLLGEINPDYLWGVSTGNNISKNVEFFVLDPNHNLLFSSNPRYQRLPEAVLTQVTAGTSEKFHWNDQGEELLGSYWSVFLKTKFSVTKWIVVVHESWQDIFASLDLFKKTFPFVILFSFLVVGFFSARQIQRSLEPLEKLKEETKRVANRDFSGNIVIQSGDEFEDLALSFNVMTKQLGRQFDILKTIAEIDRVTISTMDFQKILKTVLFCLREISKCECANLVLFDFEGLGQSRRYFMTRGEDQEGYEEIPVPTLEDRKRLEEKPSGFFFSSEKSLPVFLEPLREGGVTFFLVFPVFLNQKFSGFISLCYTQPIKNPKEEMAQFKQLTDQIAVALTNARMVEQIRFLAYYDPMTGLPNREFLKKRMGQVFNQAKENSHLASLLLLDLDHFKRTNDTLGHELGDKLLQAVGQRILDFISRLRKVDYTHWSDFDTHVAHIGGDEFSILLANIPDTQEVGKVARGLLGILSKPYLLDKHEIYLTATIGITIFPMDGEDVDTQLKNADTAMFKGKGKGRNNYQFYTPSMNATALEWLALEKDLRNSIENQELEIYYQPQIEITSEKIVGMEALVRWQKPNGEFISPTKFIPLAEETGLIFPMSEWILRRACEETKALHSTGFPGLHVAVNLSSLQFQKENLIQTVKQILKEAGLDPQCLELEITEGVLMQDLEPTIALLNDLKALGLSLSVDDFGTGYSSLSYLKRFPLDTLKIDQSFVRGISSNSNDEAITVAVITMAHSLQMRVVAEGVETREQFEFLREKGCDDIQGFYYSKPLPLQELKMFLEKHRNGFSRVM